MELPNLSDVRPSPLSWVVVGLMAVTFILLAKYVFNRWPVLGLNDVFNAV